MQLKCTRCGHVFDFMEMNVPECPTCHRSGPFTILRKVRQKADHSTEELQLAEMGGF